MSKSEQLQEIAEAIVADGVTPQLREGAIQMVFGVGSPDAEIVFVGEAPGAKEDEQGEPFVGAEGKLLNELLAGIGLERKDVYITNLVKYRPPNNRDPLPEEIEAFVPYLKRQLAVIKPKVVAFLGRHSMSVFLPELKISQAHGRPVRKGAKCTCHSSTRQPPCTTPACTRHWSMTSPRSLKSWNSCPPDYLHGATITRS